MFSIFPLLILAGLAAPASAEHDTDAVEIFHCDFKQQFGQPCDVNYDGWPDRWKRATGPGFPHYVQIALADDETATAERCLTIRANGGNAEVQSPMISVSTKFGYVAEARIRVKDIGYGEARVVLEFCNEEREVLQTAASDWIRRTDGWLKATIGPVNIEQAEVRLVRVKLELVEGDRVDLLGTVSLDDVWIARLPKMTVRTNSPFNVYTDPQDVRVTCELSGVQESNPDILFELLDASSHQLSDDRVQLQGRLITERLSKASDIIGSDIGRPAGYTGESSWEPPITEPGFYRVRVTMKTARGMLNHHVINLAVVPPLDRPAEGEFGWSLAGGQTPLDYDQLVELLPLISINWVKLPVWYSEANQRTGDQLALLTEKLAARDIEVVGVVDHPPPDSDLAKRLANNASIADALSSDPSSWLPMLDPILTRLSLRVRWWQLGEDHDVSYAGFPDLEQEIARIRETLFRFGQDVKLGIGWRWLMSDQNKQLATWEFQQFSADPALTGAELGAYLALPTRLGIQRWVMIEPLAAGTYDLETRSRDLVEQMLAAKIHGADAAFVALPFDVRSGLMTPEGTPGELLLPWRTTSALLSATEYLGSIQLPRGSENRLFATPRGDVLMVVWNDHETTEVIHLGHDIRVVDVWGRERTPLKDGGREVLDVGPMPTFIRGLEPHIARWRIGARFTRRHIPSIFGKAHANVLEFRNEFPQGVGGSVSVRAPQGWQVGPAQLDFKLATGGLARERFALTLPLDANSGNVPIRADFVVTAQRRHEFSVYRKLSVGDGQVELEVHTRLAADGALVVEQRMVNRGSQPVDFKCLLYAPGHRRQRTQVFRLGPNEDLKTYRLNKGEDLIGKELWLRVEETTGTRVLNHRFKAEP